MRPRKRYRDHPMNDGIGQGSYQAGRSHPRRPSPHDVAAMVVKKVELRALLAIEAQKIEEAVIAFDEAEAQELVALLAKHESEMDGDIDQLRRQAEQRAHEEAQVRKVKPIAVPLTLCRGCTRSAAI